MTSCQPVWHTRIVLRNVAVVVVDGFLPFEFGTICEVFGVDRADDRLPSYQLSLVARGPPPWVGCAGRPGPPPGSLPTGSPWGLAPRRRCARTTTSPSIRLAAWSG